MSPTLSDFSCQASEDIDAMEGIALTIKKIGRACGPVHISDLDKFNSCYKISLKTSSETEQISVEIFYRLINILGDSLESSSRDNRDSRWIKT